MQNHKPLCLSSYLFMPSEPKRQPCKKLPPYNRKRNRIHGRIPTLDELLDPKEEREVGDSPYEFEGGDRAIVGEVQHEMAVASGEAIEVDIGSEDEGERGPS